MATDMTWNRESKEKGINVYGVDGGPLDIKESGHRLGIAIPAPLAPKSGAPICFNYVRNGAKSL